MLGTQTDDARLVRACLDGETGAWEALVRRYGQLVGGIASGAGLDADEAADLFQTVFVIVWRNLGLLDRPAAVAGWIATIARREAWRAKRRRDRDTGGELLPDALAREPTAEARIERAERAFQVGQGVAALDERCRRLIEALFWRDPTPTYDELSQELGVPVGSLGPTRARCLEKLRIAMTSMGFAEP
ncbi:MAG: RNA polymerase sigma factor [Gemmatimonadota bacterium]